MGGKSRSVFGLQGATLGYFLERNSVLWADRVAVVDISREKKATYRELNERVNKLANSLQRMGIKHGDHVAYLLNDKLECVEVMFALNRLGAVWVPCNCRFTANEIAAQLRHADAAALIFDEQYGTTVADLQQQLAIPDSRYISVGEPSDRFVNYEAFLLQGSPRRPDVQVAADEPCGLIYTSGTTGVPKGAVHTHQTLIGWAMIPIMATGWRSEDNVLNPYPMFHLGGTVISMAAVLCGATNTIFGSFQPEKFLRTVEQERITAAAVVPTILNAILKLPQEVIASYDWSSLQRLSTSSAPLMSEAQELVLKYWPEVKLFTLYSATELFFSVLLPEDHRRKTRCVGKPAFGMELKVVNEHGEQVQAGEIGQIYGRGCSLFSGYYKNPEADANGFRGDWFTCEDMGYLDEEGYLYIVDRKKDMIITGGENVSSVEVEDVLITHDDVLEVAVIGVPDDLWGERVHAVVSLKPGRTVTGPELLEWCKERMAGYKRPRSIDLLPEVPKSAVGKISKKELRERMSGRERKQ